MNNTPQPSSLVPKPWGAEYQAFADPNVAIWYLHLKRGEGTSYHYHEAKLTILVVLNGDVKINNDFCGPGEHRIMPAGHVHRTVALTDAWVMEIETPSDKGDLIRVSDAYGREGKPYEAKRLPINGYEYPSKEFP